MPIVAHSKLPTFARLKAEGENILEPNRAQQQDIRELHIGLLNMMPDAALAATERQFFRLIGESNQIAQFYVHPFSLPQIHRSQKGQDYITEYYEDFGQIRKEGLDALIITGANVTQPALNQEPFWSPLSEVIEWAYENVTSTLCSCLATHAVMEFRHGKKRHHLGKKRWGIFHHQVTDINHPLVNDINTLLDVPHSRFNEISRQQFEEAGLHVLVESGEAGVHLAVSEDLFRIVYFQGHPEYDTISLLKEYKREVLNFFYDKRKDYPPFPENYLGKQSQAILQEFAIQLQQHKQAGKALPEFPEALIVPRLHNTWHDTAEAVINNWIGKVYQVTNNDRRYPFMKEVDPKDPLNIKS